MYYEKITSKLTLYIKLNYFNSNFLSVFKVVPLSTLI